MFTLYWDMLLHSSAPQPHHGSEWSQHGTVVLLIFFTWPSTHLELKISFNLFLLISVISPYIVIYCFPLISLWDSWFLSLLVGCPGFCVLRILEADLMSSHVGQIFSSIIRRKGTQDSCGFTKWPFNLCKLERKFLWGFWDNCGIFIIVWLTPSHREGRNIYMDSRY